MTDVPHRILELVETFDRNIDTYRSQAYNEMQLRREFIDPFFEELGWDVSNKQGFAPAYRDVIHEDAVKVGTATKAPDYGFCIGGVRNRKFFLEAKKPAVDIKDDGEPAYQLRRYAWSAKLPLSVLTDFEEFAVYDCLIKPKHTDRASVGRIMYLTYKEYADRWDEIAATFSKDAVLKGSFDRFATTAKGKHGTTPVDVAFLDEIEKWRRGLAQTIAHNNRSLSKHEMNFAVQQTIDRILFLRMCEDRGIEPYKQLDSLTNGNRVYPRLCELFERADKKYNSGLFYFQPEKGRAEPPDELTLNLVVEDPILKLILSSLYYPQCPYEFYVIPPEILGNVYEQFLGRVVTVSPARRVSIDEKPEVKKAGGVYYTPSYIVDYIVKNTVGKLLGDPTVCHCEEQSDEAILNKLKTKNSKLKTPKEVANLRILDPACGSGSFLLGAYTYLLDYHRDWYVANDPAKYTKQIYRLRADQWHLTIAEKKKILLNNIFGVDIDSQAVEVTKLSLLLKVLEGENQETVGQVYKMFHERALPDLGNNIKCGNSLIGPDFFDNPDIYSSDDELRRKINAFGWHAEFPQVFKQGGFDIVIGNPPYGAFLSNDETHYLFDNFKFQAYKLDTYLLFVEQALNISKKIGLIGMIIPNTWLLNLLSTEFRKQIFNCTQIENIRHYRRPVFINATVDTEVIVIKKCTPAEKHHINILIVEKNGNIDDYTILQERWRKGDGQPVNIFERPELVNLADKLKRMDVLDNSCVITQGAKPFQVGKGDPPQTHKIVDEKPFVSEKRKDATFRPLLRGSLIQKYRILWNRDYWISFGDWLAEPRYSAQYDTPKKIVVRQTGDSLVATLDCEQFIVRDNLYTIVAGNNGLALQFVLGLLNSRLLNWYYQKILNPEQGEPLAQVKRGHLAKLPIPQLDLSTRSDKAKHDKMVNLVDRMLDLHKKLAVAKVPDEKTKLQRQISTTDSQIDNLVYDLYNLTPEEIKLVEGNSS